MLMWRFLKKSLEKQGCFQYRCNSDGADGIACWFIDTDYN
jgi:hypothetical protein